MKTALLLSIALCGLPLGAQTRAQRLVKPEAATVTYEQIAPMSGCDSTANLPTILSSGCLVARIRVTVHPASPSAVGAFALVVYRSISFPAMTETQSQFTMARDTNGDFVAVFLSGDMSEIVISGVEIEPGSLVIASAN